MKDKRFGGFFITVSSRLTRALVRLGLGLLPLLWSTSARAQGIGTDITDLTIQTISSLSSSVPGIAGDDQFAGQTFTLNFGGDIQSITGFTYVGGDATLKNAIPASVVHVRRNPVTDGRYVAFYQGTLNPNTFTFTFPSTGPLADHLLVSDNNILVGRENVLQNTGSNDNGVPWDGNSSIERIDFVLDRAVKAHNDKGFVVIEKGPSTGHDGFGIAAMTGVDGAGNPTAYGQIFMVATGTWGLTALVNPTPTYYALNNAAGCNIGLPINPAIPITGHTLGGIMIRTSELVPKGQRVYGYSLFATDVTCTPETLLDVTNPCFPTNTGEAGGLDPAAANLGAVTVKNH